MELVNLTAPVGGNAAFSASLTQTGLSGTWTKDGTPLSNDGRIQIYSPGTNFILSIGQLQLSDAGTYKLTIAGQGEASAILTVTGMKLM